MKNSLTLAININLWLFLFVYVLLHSFSLCRPRAATPLLFAAESGNLDVCQFLVEHKADVNAQNDMYDSRPIRMHLKNSGVIICFNFFSFYSVSGQSSLHWSSANGHIDVCQFLVEHKADVNAKDKQYNTHPCTCIGVILFCFQLFFSRSSLFRSNCPLHASSGEGHLLTCKFLVEHEADINAQNYMYGNSYSRNQKLGYHYFSLQSFMRFFCLGDSLPCIGLLYKAISIFVIFSSSKKLT